MSVQTFNRYQHNTIRNNFLSESLNNQDLCHEIDVYRVCTDDWSVNRFLLVHKDQKKAQNALIKATHWKMEFGVHDMTQEHFPRELYERGEPEIFGRDKQGKYIVWSGMRNKNEPYIDEIIDLRKRWLAYFMEKLSQIVHDKSYISICSMSGSENYNLRKYFSSGLMKFNLDWNKYYPSLVSCTLYVDIPKAHSTMAKMLVSIGNKMVKGVQSMDIKFISSDQLTEFVDWQLIPVEMRGPRMPNIVVPANAKLLKELDHWKFSDKAYQLFNEHQESVLENIKKFSNK